MNTNLMTICNLLAQQSGKHVLSPNISQNGDQGAQSRLNKNGTIQKGTDNNYSEVKIKPKSKDNLRFDSALREKMTSDDAGQTQDRNNKEEEKGLYKNTPKTDLVNMAIPSVVIQEQPEDKIEIAPIVNKNPETPENAPAIKPIVASSVEIIPELPSSMKEAMPASENNASNDTIEIPSDTIPTDLSKTVSPITGSEVVIGQNEENDLTQVAPETQLNTVESAQTGLNDTNYQDAASQKTAVDEIIADKTTDQQELPLQNIALGDSKASSDIEVPTHSTRPVTHEQGETTSENNIAPKSDHSKLISQSDLRNTPEAFDLRQKNVLNTTQEKPQNTVLNPMPDQKSDSNLKVDAQPDVQPAQSSIHKLNVAAEQINRFQTEKMHYQSEKAGVNVISEDNEAFSVDDTKPSIFIEESNVTPFSERPTGNINSGLGLGRQIQETVSTLYRPGTQQIVIRLDPPDLGRVTIKFIEQRDGITGILHVDKAQTKDQIQDALPGIVQNLQNLNVPVKKLDVLLSNQQHDSSPDENSNGSGNHLGHHNPHNPHNPNSFDSATSYHDWAASRNNAQNVRDSEIQMTDDSINMLI